MVLNGKRFARGPIRLSEAVADQGNPDLISVLLLMLLLLLLLLLGGSRASVAGWLTGWLAGWLSSRSLPPNPYPPMSNFVGICIYISEIGGKGVLTRKCSAKGPRKLSEAVAD